jgi:hypothetical protein
MTGFFVYGLIGIGFAALAYGWTMTSYWPVSIFLLILASLFLYLVKRKFSPALSIALTLGTIFAAIGISLGMSFPLALTGLLTLLAAWDLDSFSRRLAFAAADDDSALIERQHLLRVGLVLLLGVGFSLASLNIRLKFNFELALGLILLTFLGLGALVNWLRSIEH